MTTAIAAEKKTLAQPDDLRTFKKGRLELVNIGGGVVGRLTLESGWRWSEHVKPVAGTELCEAPHFQYHASGVLHIVMANGTEFDAKQGDITACLRVTTPGSWVTSTWCSSTGTAPATTPRPEPRRAPPAVRIATGRGRRRPCAVCAGPPRAP